MATVSQSFRCITLVLILASTTALAAPRPQQARQDAMTQSREICPDTEAKAIAGKIADAPKAKPKQIAKPVAPAAGCRSGGFLLDLFGGPAACPQSPAQDLVDGEPARRLLPV